MYGITYTEGREDNLEELREKIHKDEKLILFNPQPFGTYNCPDCGNSLEDVS